MMALPQAKQDATDARLAALTLPVQDGWTRAARTDALARLTKSGLPGPRDEYWRWTRPAELNAVEPAGDAPGLSVQKRLMEGPG